MVWLSPLLRLSKACNQGVIQVAFLVEPKLWNDLLPRFFRLLAEFFSLKLED